MHRIVRMVTVLAALTAGGTGAASAQGLLPIAVEARAGLALPQGDWSGAGSVDTGFGYGFNFRLQLFPLISAYGGWDRYTFNVSGSGGDAEDTGFHLGAQASLPLSALTGVSPFAFAGMVFNRTTMSFGDVNTSVLESDRGLGYEVGAGLAFPFMPTLTLTPQVRYRSHGADFPSSAAEDQTVSYLSFDLGVRLGI